MAFKLLLKDLKPYTGRFVAAILFGILASAFRTYPMTLIQQLFETWQNKPFDEHKAMYIPAVIAVCWTFSSVFRYLISTQMRSITEKICLSLRVQLLNKYLYSSLDFLSHQTTGRGGLISKMLSDIGIIQGGFSKIADLIKEPVVVIFTLGYLFYIDVKLTLILFLSLPLVFYIIRRITKSLKKHSRKNQETMQELSLSLKETLDGSKIIRSFNLEQKMEADFQTIIDKYLATKVKIIQREEVSSPLTETISTIIFSSLLYLIGKSISSGELSTPLFMQYVALLIMCTDSAKKIQSAYVRIQESFVARTRLDEILNIDDTIKDAKNPKAFPKDWDKISFKNVSFIADNNHILKNINLDIPRGQKIALVGQSGSGKTTLINLIERFIEPTSGNIEIGGVDIRDIKISELRDHISLVSQDVFLFHDSISKNIASGTSKKVNSEDIKNAAQTANADQFISNFPQAYDTPVGESGQTKLSGGEKQRISISRAVIKEAPILLLDEATSALDTESEFEVQKGLDQLASGRTSIIIAHRLSTIQNADKIYVLKNGEIIQSGSHDDLAESHGIYQKLLNLNF